MVMNVLAESEEEISEAATSNLHIGDVCQRLGCNYAAKSKAQANKHCLEAMVCRSCFMVFAGGNNAGSESSSTPKHPHRHHQPSTCFGHSQRPWCFTCTEKWNSHRLETSYYLSKCKVCQHWPAENMLLTEFLKTGNAENVNAKGFLRKHFCLV